MRRRKPIPVSPNRAHARVEGEIVAIMASNSVTHAVAEKMAWDRLLYRMGLPAGKSPTTKEALDAQTREKLRRTERHGAHGPAERTATARPSGL